MVYWIALIVLNIPFFWALRLALFASWYEFVEHVLGSLFDSDGVFRQPSIRVILFIMICVVVIFLEHHNWGSYLHAFLERFGA